jgi:hypothetical protein
LNTRPEFVFKQVTGCASAAPAIAPYSLARFLGDVQAVKRGRVSRRLVS